MDERLSRIITQSTQRLLDELAQVTPDMSAPVSGWMKSLAGGHAPEAYFKHPLAFPTLLLPWWLEETLSQQMDLDFQADIAHSSINGYYFIRMIDNVMDGEDTVEKKLLPALAFFHAEFQTAYQKHFAPNHPFWDLFRKVWFGTAEAAIHDARIGEITLATFERASSQKVRAAQIPVAAVCYKYGRPDLLEPWLEFVLRLGKWHQMFNDVFDWHKDSQRGNRTYFLSEAARQKRAGESELAWILREGLAQGCDNLRLWMLDAQDLADTLRSPSLSTYLKERVTLFEERARASLEGAAVLGKLAAATA